MTLLIGAVLGLLLLGTPGMIIMPWRNTTYGSDPSSIGNFGSGACTPRGIFWCDIPDCNSQEHHILLQLVFLDPCIQPCKCFVCLHLLLQECMPVACCIVLLASATPSISSLSFSVCVMF